MRIKKKQWERKVREIYLAGFDIWSVSTSSLLSKDKLGWEVLAVSESHSRCCKRAKKKKRRRQEIFFFKNVKKNTVTSVVNGSTLQQLGRVFSAFGVKL